MKKTTNNNLSDSWTISPLSKVIIALESGSRPKGGVKHITDGIPSLGAEHIDKNGTFDFTNIRYVPEDFAIRMTRGSIRKGDILVVKDGATTGETSLVRESFPYKRAVINEHVFLCRCNEDVIPDYIFYYLFSSNGNQSILKDFRGAAQGDIEKGIFGKAGLKKSGRYKTAHWIECLFAYK
ncbi:MAG: type I restriction endonuclease subunit S [Nitrospirae bacterium]|nr:type I restriction endonuclease subunit S [Nitrospirota bacterium]